MAPPGGTVTRESSTPSPTALVRKVWGSACDRLERAVVHRAQAAGRVGIRDDAFLVNVGDVHQMGGQSPGDAIVVADDDEGYTGEAVTDDIEAAGC